MRPAGLVADRIADSIQTSASSSGSSRKLVFSFPSSLLHFFRAFSLLFNGSRKNCGRGAARGGVRRPSRRNFSNGRDISTRGGKILTRSCCPLRGREKSQNASVGRGYSLVVNGSRGRRSSSSATY